LVLVKRKTVLVLVAAQVLKTGALRGAGLMKVEQQVEK
jgi:hypothetical protein